MSYLLGIIGLFVTLGLAYLISSNKKAIKLKPLIVMFILQLVLGFVLLRTTFGTAVVSVLAKMFDHLLAFAGQGVDFVFAGQIRILQWSSFCYFRAIGSIYFHKEGITFLI